MTYVSQKPKAVFRLSKVVLTGIWSDMVVDGGEMIAGNKEGLKASVGDSIR